MSDVKHVVVTREGLQRMKEELEYKETTEKMKVAEQLKVAISYGDLSENAEYDAAKNDQAVLEQRIAELKAMIETECRQLGLLTQMKAIIEAYRFSRGPQQISLF